MVVAFQSHQRRAKVNPVSVPFMVTGFSVLKIGKASASQAVIVVVVLGLPLPAILENGRHMTCTAGNPVQNSL